MLIPPSMDTRTLWGEHALALRRRGLADGTIRQRHYLVTAWFRWCELNDVGVFDADAEDVERFLDAIDLQLALVFAQEGPAADPRVEAAILLGAVSGLRCCELARLRWEDVHDGQARVLGKGSKERVVPLNAETVAALERIERTSEFVLDGWQGRVHGEPGERASVRLAAHFRRAGAAGSAHRLRHRAATEALRKCHDLRKVQTLLGHESVATTAIYTKVDTGDLAAIIADVTTVAKADAPMYSSRTS